MLPLVILLISLVVLLCSALLVLRTPGTTGRILIVAAVGSLVAGGIWWTTGRSKKPEPAGPSTEFFLPRKELDGGYVSSSVCQSCHQEQYSSWHKSYHRTMTQKATPATVVAPFEGVRLQSRSGEYFLERNQDSFWVKTIDPAWAAFSQKNGRDVDLSAEPPLIRKKIVMTTGSHHMQTYWIPAGRGNELQQFPWYYHVKEQRWIPAEDSYIVPPDDPYPPVTWNTNCIVCHSVRGRPQPHYLTGVLNSDVVELGIACEACHGPGERHVQRHRNAPAGAAHDPDTSNHRTIINPANLSNRASSEVCGQCHASFTPVDSADWWQNGYRFRPGDRPLKESHRLLSYDNPHVSAKSFERDGFWPDGTKRIGGREYPAMIRSACFQRGNLSCLSCHSMHQSDPDDQLAEQISVNQACLNCHPGYAKRIEEHTHHRTRSPGSRCYNCHMPHTTYALFKAIRSHRIDSPSVANSKRTGRPNACNQCHLDRSLAWTARHLSDWYGAPDVDLDRDQTAVSASVLWLLKGDAVQRAVTAWTLGWKPAVSASGKGWQPPLLAQLLDDPYSAVRFVAYRSLRTFPGFEDFEYDFVAPAQLRSAARERALEIWRSNYRNDPKPGEGRVLIGADGRLSESEVRRLMEMRDDRPVRLPE